MTLPTTAAWDMQSNYLPVQTMLAQLQWLQQQQQQTPSMGPPSSPTTYFNAASPLHSTSASGARVGTPSFGASRDSGALGSIGIPMPSDSNPEIEAYARLITSQMKPAESSPAATVATTSQHLDIVGAVAAEQRRAFAMPRAPPRPASPTKPEASVAKVCRSCAHSAGRR
jgi:hypothetical protein